MSAMKKLGSGISCQTGANIFNAMYIQQLIGVILPSVQKMGI
jgi:hypothetical protein